MRLLQIVPALGADGVGAYARRLGEVFAGQGIATAALASRSSEESNGARVIPGHEARLLEAALESWWREGEGGGVLLHYANYGYEQRGCPVWLATGLHRWLARRGGRRVATFFHEVAAFGPPWRSSFWLSPLQRRLAAAVAGGSAGLGTSLQLYRDLLARMAPQRRIEVLPVFSAVGEPERVPPLGARARQIVVFGSPGIRRRAYARRRADLEAACRALDIDEVLDIGPSPAGPLPAEAAGRPVRRCGALPETEVSRLLLGACAGFLAYPPDFLPKSTIFAAYCAHGVVPVVASLRGNGNGPPRAGEHYLSPWPASRLTEADLAAVAARAHAWYEEHSLARQAPAFAGLIFGGARPA